MIKTLFKNFWLSLGLIVGVVILSVTLKFLIPVIVFLIFLALIPVAIDLFFGLLVACGWVVAAIGVLLWGHRRTSR